jgi:LysM repeat protein
MRSLLVFLLLATSLCFAQPAEYKLSREEYIERFKEDAIREMYLHKIPASITLAQALVETGDGNSPLAKYANNHFGIKCHGWKSFSYAVDDDQYNECFRKYASVDESYEDHSKFLLSRPWYKPLFELRINDYEGWARGLKAAGYATHPQYAEMLIKIIEENELYKYDVFDSVITKPIEPMLAKKIQKKGKKELMAACDLKHVIVKQGDSYTRLALKYNITMKKLHEYNDLSRDVKLTPGMIVYLQAKRLKDEVIAYHLVNGETLHEISQVHGIKLSSLLEMNPELKEKRLEDGMLIRLNDLPLPLIESEPVAFTKTTTN